MMRQFLTALLASGLLAAPASAQGQASLPEACTWVSEVTPQAVIRFTSTNGTGLRSGQLLYRGRVLLPVYELQSQGYGSRWWSLRETSGPTGPLVVFSADRPVRGTPGYWEGRRSAGAMRVLLVGLGSALYYGSDSRWREDHTLLTAAEGFWRLSPGCPALL